PRPPRGPLRADPPRGLHLRPEASPPPLPGAGLRPAAERLPPLPRPGHHQRPARLQPRLPPAPRQPHARRARPQLGAARGGAGDRPALPDLGPGPRRPLRLLLRDGPPPVAQAAARHHRAGGVLRRPAAAARAAVALPADRLIGFSIARS